MFYSLLSSPLDQWARCARQRPLAPGPTYGYHWAASPPLGIPLRNHCNFLSSHVLLCHPISYDALACGSPADHLRLKSHDALAWGASHGPLGVRAASGRRPVEPVGDIRVDISTGWVGWLFHPGCIVGSRVSTLHLNYTPLIFQFSLFSTFSPLPYPYSFSLFFKK